jgi:DnaK suppressor protein
MTTPLTDAQKAKLRSLLETKQRELAASTERELSTFGGHDEKLSDSLDVGARESEETELAGIGANESALLVEVRHALAKFADDSYGVSELSGEPIPFTRLQAVPWARHLVEEEERIERTR